jgi:lipoate-protein ligase A
MQLLDLTLDTPAENVGLDEALLEQAEAAVTARECLRIWEPASPLVVVGRASRIHQEVQRDACESRQIPIIRRCSGGTAIVGAPGCLMYALILSYQLRPELRDVGQAHCVILRNLVRSLRRLLPHVTVAGTSDLALESDETRKFSGNSLRCRRNHLLYHGTLLHGMPLGLMDTLLRHPPRQPDYRAGRPHSQFVVNAPIAAADLRDALIKAWQPTDVMTNWPRAATTQLVQDKYGCPEWNLRL